MHITTWASSARQRTRKVSLTRWMTEAVIAWNYFTGWYVALFMLAGAIFFAFDASFGPDRYPIWFSKAFFVGWNVIVLITMHLIWRFGVFQLST